MITSHVRKDHFVPGLQSLDELGDYLRTWSSSHHADFSYSQGQHMPSVHQMSVHVLCARQDVTSSCIPSQVKRRRWPVRQAIRLIFCSE